MDHLVVRRFALRVVLNHPAVAMLIMALTLGINVYLYIKVPKGFFPQQDTGRMQGQIRGQPAYFLRWLFPKKFSIFEEHVVRCAKPGGSHGRRRLRAPADAAGIPGWLFPELKPLEERQISADAVIARIRQKTSGMPGATLFLQSAQDIRIGGRQSNAQYQYTLQTPELSLLAEWGPKVLAALQKVPEIVDVSSDQQNSGLSSNVVIDRDTASRLGLTAQAVDSALNDAFGQRQVSTMYKSINQYHVVEALQQKWWQSPDVLNKVYIQTPRGLSVPLSTFTSFNEGLTPLSLPHQGQFPATTISFNLPVGVSLDQAELAITKAVIDIGMPATISGKWAGTAQALQDSINGQPVLILTALLAVYIVLGILYESLIHPLTIISTLPSAGVGALICSGSVPDGADDYSHDRHHPADRIGKEKRHYDDRFRPGC